jgi:hypothetical protein
MLSCGFGSRSNSVYCPYKISAKWTVGALNRQQSLVSGVRRFSTTSGIVAFLIRLPLCINQSRGKA